MILHVDAALGDDDASGRSWGEPLRSLAAVQARIDAGARVVGIELAAGWYAGTLRLQGDVTITGGHPSPAWTEPTDGWIQVDPERNAVTIDGLGAGPVVEARSGTLHVSGVTIEGGAVAPAVLVRGGSLTVDRCTLRGHGSSLVTCADCPRAALRRVQADGSAGRLLEVRGALPARIELREVAVDGLGTAVSADAADLLRVVGGDLSGLVGAPFALPDGLRPELEDVALPDPGRAPRLRSLPRDAAETPGGLHEAGTSARSGGETVAARRPRARGSGS